MSKCVALALPKGWVVKWCRRSRRKVDLSKTVLYWSKKQGQEDGFISSKVLHRELLSKKPLTGDQLDYLLERPKHIPEEWQGRVVCFWGTIYRDPRGEQWVRTLFWQIESDPRMSHWEWAFRPLKLGFDINRPAVLAK